MKILSVTVLLAVVLAWRGYEAHAAHASSLGELRAREHRVVHKVERAKTTIRWFEHRYHGKTIQWLTKHPSALRAVNFARQRVILGRAELVRIHALIKRLAPKPHEAWAVPDWFMQQALCVHDGYWHQAHAPFARTGNVPDGVPGGLGEAPWNNRSYYRGGMQFAFSTWARAGGHGDPADASPAEQIYRAYVIVVRQDGGSWHEWPQTSRACGWR